MREKKPPSHTGQLVRDFEESVKKLSDRTIQKSFVRAYSVDFDGSKNEDLIPQGILDWYPDFRPSDDEEQSSDLESEEMDVFW